MNNVILLVDDDQNILHGLARALRCQPYQLYTATSGKEALLILKARRVDVIVSDEQMPGMSGVDLLAWVAENCPDVIRIMLTGRPTLEIALRAINAGAVYQFFLKPCDPALLGVAIRKAIEHRALLLENQRLIRLNGDRMREIERFRRNLEILTAVVSRDIHQPLQTVVDCCRTLGEQYRDVFDPKAMSLAESALDGIGEVQRLVNALQELCATGGHESIGGRCSSSPESTARPACELSACPNA